MALFLNYEVMKCSQFKEVKMADYKRKSQDAFDSQALTYDDDKNGKHAREQYSLILSEISTMKFTNVVDIGCGTGEIIKNLVSKYPNVKFTGVDLSEKMLEQAKDKLCKKAVFILGDAERLPLESDSFDLVICNDSFHHYPNPQQAICEFNRILKKDGILLLSDYWKPWLLRQIMNVFIRFSKDGDVKVYSKEEITSFLSKGGFSEVSYKIIGNSAYMVLARKLLQE